MKTFLFTVLLVFCATVAQAEDISLASPVYPVAQSVKARVEIDAITMSAISYTIKWLDASGNEVHQQHFALTDANYDAIWKVLIPANAVGKELGKSLNTYIINKIKAIHGI